MPRPVKTALHQAVLDQRIHQVRLLVRQFPHLLNSRDMYGQTPLTVACRLEDEEVCNRISKILISAGTEVDIQDNHQRSALSYAAQKGRPVIVRRILKRDIFMNLSETDKDGNTPLHLAAEAGQPDIVDILVCEFLKYHLNIDCPNSDGFTPLLLACKNDNFVSAYILLTKGNASPDKKDIIYELDAAEWIHKIDKKMFPYINNNYIRTQTSFNQSHKHGESFFRNRIMYERPFTPICRHGSVKMPLSISMNLTRDFMKENITQDGADARQAVLEEIIRVSRYNRPVSTKSCKTSLLFQVSDKKRTGKNRIDIVISTLFRIYSEQQLTKDALDLTVPVSSHFKNCNSLNSQSSQSASVKTSLPFIKVTS